MLARFAITIALAAPAAAQPIELVNRWEPGETVRTRLTIDQEREVGPLDKRGEREPDRHHRKSEKGVPLKRQAGGAQDSAFPIDFGSRQRSLTCDLTQRVAKIDAAGIARIEITITRLAAEADMADESRFVFDSAKPNKAGESASRRAARLAAIVGRAMTMRIGRDGVVHEAAGVHALAEALTLLEDDNALGLLMLEQSKDTPGGIDSLFVTGISMLPREPVRRGERWLTETVHEWPLIGRITTSWESRLSRVERKGRSLLATIECSADIRPTTAAASPARGAIPAGIEIEMRPGTGRATTIFDTTLGRAASATMTVEMPVAVRIGQGNESIGVLQTVRTTMRHEVLPGEHRTQAR